MERKIGKLDPEWLKRAKAEMPDDPLHPDMLAAVRELFKPEEYEQYVKEWTERLAPPNQQSA